MSSASYNFKESNNTRESLKIEIDQILFTLILNNVHPVSLGRVRLKRGISIFITISATRYQGLVQLSRYVSCAKQRADKVNPVTERRNYAYSSRMYQQRINSTCLLMSEIYYRMVQLLRRARRYLFHCQRENRLTFALRMACRACKMYSRRHTSLERLLVEFTGNKVCCNLYPRS